MSDEYKRQNREDNLTKAGRDKTVEEKRRQYKGKVRSNDSDNIGQYRCYWMHQGPLLNEFTKFTKRVEANHNKITVLTQHFYTEKE